MSFFHNKSVLITGASSGIGEELARQLGEAGAELTLTARREALLERLAERIATASSGKAIRPLVVKGDVTNDADVQRAVTESIRRWGKLDIAIANAGFAVVGPLKELSVEDYRRQFETNLFGVLRTIKAALPEIEKARGNIVIIGSVAGWVSAPGASAYSMTKFALRALANAITPELRRSGVTVTLITPGFVESEIRGAGDPIPKWLVMRTDRAVRQILSAVAKGRPEAIITGHGKMLVALARFAPWVIRATTARWSWSSRGGEKERPT